MRLDTPVRIGIAMRASARASSSELSPWRSVPNARIARGGSVAGSRSLAGGVEREQRAVRRGRQSVGQARDGQRVVQAGAAAQGVGMPGVVAAGGEHRGGVRGRADAHAGAHVAEVARVLQQHHGRGTRIGEHSGRVDRGALGEGDHAGRRGQRGQLGEYVGGDLARERDHLRGHVGRELGGECS